LGVAVAMIIFGFFSVGSESNADGCACAHETA